MDRGTLYDIAYLITLGTLTFITFVICHLISPIIDNENTLLFIGGMIFLLLLYNFTIPMTDKLVELMDKDSRRSNRLIVLGLKPAKPNVLARFIYSLLYHKSERCICGRPFNKVWKVNIDIFNGYVYDPHLGEGEEWIWTVLCIHCFRKNHKTLKKLENERIVKAGKEAYRRIDDNLVWKPLNEFLKER